ncbi:DUF975 family protein [Lapidilactobacillus wuchangensis]|uniref:DUF975 family protein n=1 Tax=Lapidilactobacillus wuchangensis TaxID=2486001 RepID=UPI000F76D87D|nr:DUF975 family protein [Lapidilactobacillus wuchangensis]
MNEKVTRADLKKRAKAKMRGDFGTAFKLNSIPIIFTILAVILWTLLVVALAVFMSVDKNATNSINSAASAQQYVSDTMKQSNGQWFGTFIGALINTMLSAGISIASLSWLRLPKDETLNKPFVKQFQGFTSDYFVAILIIFIITSVITYFGYFLLIIPGIILALAFQPIYLLYSDEGDNYGYFNIIGRSWQFMRGHKFDLFVFQLSFIFWYVGMFLTLGLLGIYFIPYRNLALAAFYDNIVAENRANDAQVAA